MKKDMAYYIRISGEAIAKNAERIDELTQEICEQYKDSKKEDIVVIASGSSLNASISAKPFMKKILGCKIECISPTDYINYEKEYHKNDFIVLISQSGCSTNIIEAAKDLNNDELKYIALTGNVNGDLKEYTNNIIEYGVGNETIDYVTLGMTTLIEFLMMFSLKSSFNKKIIDQKIYEEIFSQIKQCKNGSEEMFEKVAIFAEENHDHLLKMDKSIIVSDGPNMGTIREGSLKFVETLKIPSPYYENEEYVHGPNMQLTPDYTVFFVDTNHKSDRIKDVYLATRLVTDHSFLITNKECKADEHTIVVDCDVMEELTPLYMVVFFQYIAANITPEKNDFKCHPLFDKFEEKIKSKTDDYDEIMKKKIEKGEKE